MTEPKSTTLAIRIPLELMEQIDEITREESSRTGYAIKRPDWIRAQLQKAVAEYAAHRLASKENKQ